MHLNEKSNNDQTHVICGSYPVLCIILPPRLRGDSWRTITAFSEGRIALEVARRCGTMVGLVGSASGMWRLGGVQKHVLLISFDLLNGIDFPVGVRVGFR
jgi:hypothetical protein